MTKALTLIRREGSSPENKPLLTYAKFLSIVFKKTIFPPSPSLLICIVSYLPLVSEHGNVGGIGS